MAAMAALVGTKDKRLIPSMSRCGNCYDKAVAEPFFSRLKQTRTNCGLYPAIEEDKSEIFDSRSALQMKLDIIPIRNKQGEQGGEDEAMKTVQVRRQGAEDEANIVIVFIAKLE